MKRVDNYHTYFIGSIFIEHPEGLKTTQLYHILHGKRTGSTLFQALQLNLLHYFNLFPVMSRKDFDKIIADCERNNWLKEVKKHTFVLTDSGQRHVETYFSDHYLPCWINQRKYGMSGRLFWWRVQLLTQVLSEKRHRNNKYTPVIKKHHIQSWVKIWLMNHSKKEHVLIEEMKNEWLILGSKLSEAQAEAVIRQLTGHNRIGDTQSELQSYFDMSPEEWQLFFLDSLHAFMSFLNEDVPLFHEIYRHTLVDAMENLSRSAWETKQLFQEGKTIQQVAEIKRVKPNTIGDHVIEMAVMQDTFDFSRFVSQPSRELVLEFLESNENHAFKTFYAAHPDIPFLDYRLTQIERYKHNAK